MASNAAVIGGMTGGVSGAILGDKLFGGSKGGANAPYPNRLTGKTAYDDYTNAANFYTAEGDQANAGKFTSLADKIKASHPDYNASPSAFLNPDGSVNWQALGGSAGQLASRTAAHVRGSSLWPGKASGDYASQMNAYRVAQAKQTEYAMKQGLNAEIMPSLNAAQTAADKNASTSAIDAGEENAMRSQITAGIRTSESQRLAKIGASLGLGNMTNSPAAAALASQAGADADASLSGTLTDMGIKVADTNRTQNRQDIDLASKIAQARFNVLNGDSKSIIGMQGDIASMIDALYSRDQTVSLNQQAIDAAGQKSPGVAAASGALSGAAAGAPLGPVGIGIGGALGGAAGYFGSK